MEDLLKRLGLHDGDGAGVVSPRRVPSANLQLCTKTIECIGQFTFEVLNNDHDPNEVSSPTKSNSLKSSKSPNAATNTKVNLKFSNPNVPIVPNATTNSRKASNAAHTGAIDTPHNNPSPHPNSSPSPADLNSTSPPTTIPSSTRDPPLNRSAGAKDHAHSPSSHVTPIMTTAPNPHSRVIDAENLALSNGVLKVFATRTPNPNERADYAMPPINLGAYTCITCRRSEGGEPGVGVIILHRPNRVWGASGSTQTSEANASDSASSVSLASSQCATTQSSSTTTTTTTTTAEHSNAPHLLAGTGNGTIRIVVLFHPTINYHASGAVTDSFTELYRIIKARHLV
jgi:hypothetical protein